MLGFGEMGSQSQIPKLTSSGEQHFRRGDERVEEFYCMGKAIVIKKSSV